MLRSSSPPSAPAGMPVGALPVTGLIYIFGTFPSRRGPDCAALTSARYIVVREGVGHFAHTGPLTDTAGAACPSNVFENVRGRNVSFAILSNVPARAVATIAQSLAHV